MSPDNAQELEAAVASARQQLLQLRLRQFQECPGSATERQWREQVVLAAYEDYMTHRSDLCQQAWTDAKIALAQFDLCANPCKASRAVWRHERGVMGALEVLEPALPALRIEAQERWGSSGAVCSQRPSSVQRWVLPDDIPSTLEALLGDVELGNPLPRVVNSQLLSAEPPINHEFHNWVAVPVQAVLRAAGRPRTITLDGGLTRHNGRPNWVVELVPSEGAPACATAYGEGKSARVMKDVADDLAFAYNQGQGPVFNFLIPQLYGYLWSNELRYGWLTTYDRTWLFKVVGTALFVSTARHSSDVGPSVRQVLCWMLLLSDTHNPRTAQQPDAPAGAAEEAASSTGSMQAEVPGSLWQPDGIPALEQPTASSGPADTGGAVRPTYRCLPEAALTVHGPLGSGAIGVVQAGSLYGRQVALKMADTRSAKADVRLLQHEGATYAALPHLQGDVLAELVECAYANGGNTFLLATSIVRGEPPGLLNLPSPEQQASAITGLEAIHAAGYLHGDIRPDNVICERGVRKAVFLDLGRSRRGASAAQRATEMQQLRRIIKPSASLTSPSRLRSSPVRLSFP